MAKVDFYVLDQVDEQARYTLACRLTEKAWRLKNSIHIQTMSAAEAERLDKLLWTFRDGSFVPHAIVGNNGDEPVSIGYGDTLHENAKSKDLLISLCDDVPDFVAAFGRIAEVITAEDDCRSKGRARFARYREQGHEMETHNL